MLLFVTLSRELLKVHSLDVNKTRDMRTYMKIVALERNSAGTDISMDCFMQLGEVDYYRNTVTPQEVAERVVNAEVIIANKAPLNRDTLSGAKNLKLICELATGFDNVDLEYCRKNGIRVTNVANYCTDVVAQHTFTLALALLEKLPHYDNYVKSGQYSAQDRFSNFDLPFYELAGKTWGIIGMGNIGKKVAQIATAFGCRVIFYSVTGNSSCTDYPQVDFETLLKECDVLSLHCPLSDLTRNLIDAKALQLMKNTAILINVARGRVVNNRALYQALVNGDIAAAGLDVVEDEPLSTDNPLINIKDSNKLIITPHLAWASVEARTRCVNEVYKNIEAFIKGESRNVIL